MFRRLTPEAQARRPVPGTIGVGPFDSVEDFTYYDRCITRGMAGSWLPVVYGNGKRIMQTPDAVVIATRWCTTRASSPSTAGRTSAAASAS